MTENQATLFIIFTLNGFLIGILFDFFRILRKTFKTKDLITNIEDVIFWVITGVIIIYSMCRFSNGEIRLFMILGIAIGVTFYILSISKYVIKYCVFILEILKKITSKTFKLIFFPFKSLFKILRRIMFGTIYIKIINVKSKIKKIFKFKKNKIFIHSKKVQKNTN